MAVPSHTLRPARLAAVLFTICLMLAAFGCNGGGSQIVFTSDRDGNLEIYSIDPSGEKEQNLTETASDEFSPVLSDSRQFIAFVSGAGDRTSIEVMETDGSERAQVAKPSARHGDQTWSPNGERLAYVANEDGQYTIMLVNRDGSAAAPLTSIAGDEVGDWSRSEEAIAFSVTEGPSQGIYTRNPDGVNEFRVTDQPDYSPRWSPDSKRIAFLSTRDGNPEIYIMDRDGSGLVRITDTEAAEYDIAWSPNGKFLAFVSEQDGNPELYSVSEDGSDHKRLTYNTVIDNGPAWSPSGNELAFVSYLDGDADIFVMDIDGSNQRRLTNNKADDTDPSW